MIQREYYITRQDGVKLYRTYSDIGNYIIQKPTNIKYSEAIDVDNAPYIYIESEEKIETQEEEGEQNNE